MAKREETSSLSQIYLFGYNLVQFFGWLYGFVIVILYVVREGTFHGVYPKVQTSLAIFQTLQLMEVFHCIIRLVPSNAFQTFIQILSRLIVVWGILLPIEESRESIGVPMLLVAWSIAEMTRYMYYALNIYDLVPFVLIWMRYTFFIVLYPLGVTGELLTMIGAYPYIRDRNLMAIPLPNIFNFSFYYHILLIFVMLSYIPFFPQLYFYMLSQRKKILGQPFSSCQKTK